MSAAAADELAASHARVQTEATQATFALLGLVMLIGLLGTRNLVETAVPRSRSVAAEDSPGLDPGDTALQK